MRHLALSLLLLVALALFVPVQPAHAGTVTAVECAVIAFPCPALSIIASGTQTDLVGILGIGGVDILPYAFGNADVTFNGVFTASDIGGVFVTFNGTGTATWNAAGPGFLDVEFDQSYAMNPVIVGAIGLASEFMIGNCNAAATAGGDAVAGQLFANGTLLPVMGGPGDCGGAGGNFAFAGGPALSLVTQPYGLSGLAQFAFAGNVAAGGAETITLPYGDSEEAPEPATCGLLGSGFLGLALFLKRRR